MNRVASMIKRLRTRWDGNSQISGNSRFGVATYVRVSVENDRIVILDTNGGQFYLCDGIKTGFWRGVSEGVTVRALASSMSAATGAPREQLEADLTRFVAQLLSRGLVFPLAPAKQVRSLSLFVRAIWELAAYDLQLGILGFRRVYGSVLRAKIGQEHGAGDGDLIAVVVDAIAAASSLYWRPVRCLQRSIATTRLLRSFGVPAHLIIGYRATPFLSHAWVEVAGRIVNDSQALAQRLTVLDRV